MYTKHVSRYTKNDSMLENLMKQPLFLKCYEELCKNILRITIIHL